MTVQEAITQADALCPNNFTTADKVRWLNEVDARIDKEILRHYEDDDEYTYTEYTTTDLTAELLAPIPYDLLYVYYLQSKINYAYSETDRYNNSSAMYNQAYREFANYFNSTHKAKQHKLRFF